MAFRGGVFSRNPKFFSVLVDTITARIVAVTGTVTITKNEVAVASLGLDITNPQNSNSTASVISLRGGGGRGARFVSGRGVGAVTKTTIETISQTNTVLPTITMYDDPTAGVGRSTFGSENSYPSAQVAVDSTVKGFLPPRMTGVQRDAIATPAAGLMVYNTTTNKLNFYNGTAWEAVTSA